MRVFLPIFLCAVVLIKVSAQQNHFEHVSLKNDSAIVIDNVLRSTSISMSDTMVDFHSNKDFERKSAKKQFITSTLFYVESDNHSRSVVSGYPIKSPVLAGIFSALIPGFGQIYEGDVCKGVTYMVATYGLGTCALSSIASKSVTTGIFNSCAAFGLYIWNIVNAVTSANQFNRRNSIVSIPLGNSTLGLTPTVDCMHACNGQEMSRTANAGLKLSYFIGEKK
jgi:TM2 domain-containing membrane protein YozV